MTPGEVGRDAEGELRAMIEHAVAKRPGVEVAVECILLVQLLTELPGVDALVGVPWRNALTVFGGDVPVHGAPLYADARYCMAYGVSTALYGADPWTLTETRGHNTDENLWLNDLRGATVVAGYAMGELLGGRLEAV